jgi:hypothetical protein
MGATMGRQADSCSELTENQVDGQEAPGGQGGEPSDERARLFPQSVPLQQADHRQGDHEDRHRAAGGEAGTEVGEDLTRAEAAAQAGHDARHTNDEQGIALRGESEDHHEHAEQSEHASAFRAPFPPGGGM